MSPDRRMLLFSPVCMCPAFLDFLARCLLHWMACSVPLSSFPYCVGYGISQLGRRRDFPHVAAVCCSRPHTRRMALAPDLVPVGPSPARWL